MMSTDAADRAQEHLQRYQQRARARDETSLPGLCWGRRVYLEGRPQAVTCLRACHPQRSPSGLEIAPYIEFELGPGQTLQLLESDHAIFAGLDFSADDPALILWQETSDHPLIAGFDQPPDEETIADLSLDDWVEVSFSELDDQGQRQDRLCERELVVSEDESLRCRERAGQRYYQLGRLIEVSEIGLRLPGQASRQRRRQISNFLLIAAIIGTPLGLGVYALIDGLG